MHGKLRGHWACPKSFSASTPSSALFSVRATRRWNPPWVSDAPPDCLTICNGLMYFSDSCGASQGRPPADVLGPGRSAPKNDPLQWQLRIVFVGRGLQHRQTRHSQLWQQSLRDAGCAVVGTLPRTAADAGGFAVCVLVSKLLICVQRIANRYGSTGPVSGAPSDQ